jgi:acetate kinase
MPGESILVINSGSSSLKMSLYENVVGRLKLLYDVLAEHIDQPCGKMTIKDASGVLMRTENLVFKTQREANERAATWLRELSLPRISAIGHRIVHGGPNLIHHQLISPDVIVELRRSVDFAPLHMPIAIDLIESCLRTYQSVPQFACIDTVFHANLPEAARHLPIPQNLFNEGIRRYGFHGLSYESIVHQLGKDLPARLVVAHLGSGASLAAIRAGKSVDTTMGLTPTGGIPMATRSGDIDPGVLLYLLRVKKLNGAELENIFDHHAGLLGLSGTTGDMRELEAASDKSDNRAELAIEIFCKSVQKTVGAYAAVLSGIDMLVFTGGIGENDPKIRIRICQDLGFLGIELDCLSNQESRSVISTESSVVSVRVIRALEDEQIAYHTLLLMRDDVVFRNEINLQH